MDINHGRLITELTAQLNTFSHLVEEVIHLNGMRKEKEIAEKKLARVLREQEDFYINFFRAKQHLAITAAERLNFAVKKETDIATLEGKALKEQKEFLKNIAFLDSTMRGLALTGLIDVTTHDISVIKGKIASLEQERDYRLKPLNDLLALVSGPKAKINKNSINIFLDDAKQLNPEGGFLDRLRMIGEIIVKIVSLHFVDVSDIIATQQKRNQVRKGLLGLFRHGYAVLNQCEEEPQSAPKLQI
jgi:hypothetical protein